MGNKQVSSVQAKTTETCMELVNEHLQMLSEPVCALDVWLPVEFTSKSRMMGDYQVRFCERFRGEIPLYLLDFILQI